MAKVWLKLTDTGSIFHDPTQDKTVTGKRTVQFERNPKVDKAIKNNVVVVVNEDEVSEEDKAYVDKPIVVTPTAEDTKNAAEAEQEKEQATAAEAEKTANKNSNKKNS